MELCDLVVSTSNVTIHLAGALGKDNLGSITLCSQLLVVTGKNGQCMVSKFNTLPSKTLKDWDSVALDLKEDLKKNLIRNEPELNKDKKIDFQLHSWGCSRKSIDKCIRFAWRNTIFKKR